ncbi:MAG: molybdopterin molybdotransferase MoeA [Burkholderiaceae bacterium]|nr:molybdopterin molybdotransferase MoeA [Burkholderiaceae bacterium]
MTAPGARAPSLADTARGISDADPRTYLPVERARAIVADSVEAVALVERVAIRSALDRVLAHDVVSTIDVPPHDNSAMDGYAVRGEELTDDGEARLRIVGTAYAGRAFHGAVARGEALRVMTGATLPAGLDTVVVQEVVRVEDGFVVVPPGQERGQHRRLRGEDLRVGEPALATGKRLTPADIGLLASLGVAEVGVRRRLRVAFFSTGDELRSIGDALEHGQIYDSNRYTIWSMLSRLGVEIVDMGVVRDSPEALEQAMRTAAAEADAIVSSGGVSVGEADFTREVMARLGDVAFWRIAIRPGRPMAFGRVGRACYFGLPGNPVAVMITFYFIVRDALLQMMGATPQPLPWVRARSLEPMRKRPGRTEYQRARLAFGADGRMEVATLGNQGSGVLRSMSESNCIVVLHHDQGAVAAGDEVDCVAFDGLL